MKYEVIERGSEWIVHNEGVEEARFELQEEALDHVAARLRAMEPGDDVISLCVRYEGPDA
jgi:hypothetical protein